MGTSCVERIGKSVSVLAVLLAALVCFVRPSAAQIGGHTASEGVVVLEDAEDLNFEAAGVGRLWIPSTFDGLFADTATSPGLTLAPGQTPNGALHLIVSEQYAFISGSFGVPMPSIWGASTLPSPGDLRAFTALSFLVCTNPLPNHEFQIILECYPQNGDGSFPTMYWNISPAKGTTYEELTIDLHNPTLMENHGILTAEDLLGQTRYLAFYVFAAPAASNTKLFFHVDDIKLTTEPFTAAGGWAVYY